MTGGWNGVGMASVYVGVWAHEPSAYTSYKCEQTRHEQWSIAKTISLADELSAL